MAKWATSNQNPPLAVRLGHSEGWKKLTVLACRGEKCPWNHNSVCLAQSTAILRFRPAERTPGPKGPILGPTDTVLCANGSKHGPKRAQTLPGCTLSINKENGTLHGAPRRRRDPILAFWGRFGGFEQNPLECSQTGTRRPKPAEGPFPLKSCPATLLLFTLALWGRIGTFMPNSAYWVSFGPLQSVFFGLPTPKKGGECPTEQWGVGGWVPQSGGRCCGRPIYFMGIL